MCVVALIATHIIVKTKFLLSCFKNIDPFRI